MIQKSPTFKDSAHLYQHTECGNTVFNFISLLDHQPTKSIFKLPTIFYDGIAYFAEYRLIYNKIVYIKGPVMFSSKARNLKLKVVHEAG